MPKAPETLFQLVWKKLNNRVQFIDRSLLLTLTVFGAEWVVLKACGCGKLFTSSRLIFSPIHGRTIPNFILKFDGGWGVLSLFERLCTPASENYLPEANPWTK